MAVGAAVMASECITGIFSGVASKYPFKFRVESVA